MSITTIEDDLKSVLTYDAFSGKLFWKADAKFAGQEAGYVTKRGHLILNRKGTLFQVHRVVWLLYFGSWPIHGLDHIDGNPGNNRISNLRDVGQQDNNKNKCRRKDSATGVTGVSWCKLAKKWRAYINIQKKPVRLGYFDDFDDAVITRKEAEHLYGYHPNHGRTK